MDRPRPTVSPTSPSTPSGSTIHRRQHSDDHSHHTHHHPNLTQRPFSPSPPRDTRHTSSRPPSLLFGAPAPASVALGNALDLTGLPSTPSPFASILEPRSVDGFFAAGHERQRRGSGQWVERVVAEGEMSTAMERENSDTSSTSSASPPLGARSILAALVAPHSRELTPPDAFPAETTTLPPSRSLPRLHQPTVVRRPSGRSIAFLPHPAMPSSTSGDSLSRDAASPDRRLTYVSRGRGRPTASRPLSSSSSVDNDLNEVDEMVSHKQQDHADRSSSGSRDSTLVSPATAASLRFPVDSPRKPRKELSSDEELHEVAGGVAPYSSKPRATMPSSDADASPRLPRYHPPYEPRAAYRDRHYDPLPSPNEKLAITLQAGVARHPRDGALPLQVPHVELYLAWLEPERWRWVPGRRYVPTWDLRLVGAHQVGDEMGVARWVVKSAIERLPVVWRLSAWV